MTIIGTGALSTDTDAYAGGTASAKNYLYSWALPKTTFDVTVTWQFKGCEVKDGNPIVHVEPAVAVTPHAVVDQDIGWVTLDAATIQSFFQDHTFEVKTAPSTHVLQGFTSNAVDQTGQIIGNILSAGTKILSIALGVPTGGGRSTSTCGTAQNTYSTIKKNQTQLAAIADQNSPAAKELMATIADLQAKINIKVTRLIDPGITPIPPNTSPNPLIINGKVGALTISEEQMRGAGWYSDNLPDNWGSAYQLDIYLVFEQAKPLEFACSAPCTKRAPQKLTRGALFREVAYVPTEIRRNVVELTDGNSVANSEVLYHQVQPFAQFGASRKLPLDAPIFGKANWNLTFNEYGEITDALWGSVATGVAATGLLNSAATAASSVDSERLKAAQQLDSAMLARQIENSKLQIIINNANFMQQCLALQAKGEVSQCP